MSGKLLGEEGLARARRAVHEDVAVQAAVLLRVPRRDRHVAQPLLQLRLQNDALPKRYMTSRKYVEGRRDKKEC